MPDAAESRALQMVDAVPLDGNVDLVSNTDNVDLVSNTGNIDLVSTHGHLECVTANGDTDPKLVDGPGGTAPTDGGRNDVVPIDGQVDGFDGEFLTGWVRAGADQDSLAVLLDGRSIGHASFEGPDGGSRRRFRFRLPSECCDGSAHTLAVTNANGVSLPFVSKDGVPTAEFRFVGEPLVAVEGVIDGYVNGRVRGWAIRKHLLNGDIDTSLTVQLLCGGALVAEAVADQPRMDVARTHGCDLRVGFEIQLPVHLARVSEVSVSILVAPECEQLAGSPLTIKPTVSGALEGAHTLRRTVDELCAQVFRLQQAMRAVMPVADATVTDYDAWARRYVLLLRERTKALPPITGESPLVSVIMPTHRTNLAHLTAAIESVRTQTYLNWELLIVDDGSGEEALAACLRDYAATDPRISCLLLPDNQGISAATNAAIAGANGRWVVFFDHDDLLADVALEIMVREAKRTGARFLYSDEDKIDAFGTLSDPNLKPDWNHRLLLDVNYVCHLVMVERDLVDLVGPLRPEFDGAQDHDFLLRVAEACPPERVHHIPEILYHWRKTATSTAAGGEAKPYAVEAGRRAVAEHLARRGFGEATVEAVGAHTLYRTRWNAAARPSVTIIIPYRDQIATTRRCLETLLARTDWDRWTVVLVDNGSITDEAAVFRREFEGHEHVRFRRVDEPFNYSRLNNLAAHENPADFFVFLNNDVFVESDDWLRALVDEALADPKVAIVGAKLVYPDRTVQHAGVVLGVGGVGDHAFKGLPSDHPGYLGRAVSTQRMSAVTAALMLCRADIFFDVGGFDEKDLIVAFNDVDLCLKVGRAGRSVVFTCNVVAEHHESLSRGDDISQEKAPRFFYENQLMFARWHDVLADDPYYNKSFSRERGVFTNLA